MLLARLDGVKSTGRGRWLARCPAHDDKSPSLSIRELDDGRVLLHDFAGCAVADVLAAVGLDFDALYPEKPIDHRVRPERRPFPAEDILRAIGFEALVAGITAARVAHGVDGVTFDEVDRLVVTASRLVAAVDVLDRDDKQKQNRARAEAEHA